MTKKNPTSRREARETAFQFLYANLPEGQIAESVELKKSEFEAFCDSFAVPRDEFAWELASGTGKNLPLLDEKLKLLSAHWRLERMPAVDRTVLRLGAYEILLRPDIPKIVSINEAIEVVKRFGTGPESASFINGILDKIDKPS